MNHMPRAGSTGFDLYCGAWPNTRHVGTAQPNRDETELVRMLRPRGDEDVGMHAEALLEPEAPYELEGFRGSVLFPAA